MNDVIDFCPRCYKNVAEFGNFVCSECEVEVNKVLFDRTHCRFCWEESKQCKCNNFIPFKT